MNPIIKIILEALLASQPELKLTLCDAARTLYHGAVLAKDQPLADKTKAEAAEYLGMTDADFTT